MITIFLKTYTRWTRQSLSATNSRIHEKDFFSNLISTANLAQFGRYFCLCTTSPQKVHHVLFQFWGIWLLQRSIKQFLPVKCLLLFLISTQPRNISGWYCVFWRLGDIKNKKYLRIKKMHPFLVIFVDWNWKISIKLDMSRGNRSKCVPFGRAWPPILPQN